MSHRALVASLLASVASLLLPAACAAPEADAGCAADADCAAGERCVAGGCFLPQIEPNACGNGVIDGAEACDLGLENDDEGVCTLSCRATSCGDGIVQHRRGEACDEGAANADRFAACSTVCQEVRCGDGVLDPGEGCDEGLANHDAGGTCSSICQLAACGDGIRQLGESCDGEVGCDGECRWSDRACGVHEVDGAGWTALVLREDGVLLGTGYNGGWRTLGLDLPPGDGIVPKFTPLLGELRLTAMSALDGGGVGLTTQGRIVTFGSDDQGARGDGPTRSTAPWTVLDGPALVRLEAQGDTVLGLDVEGRLWGFGSDLGGALRTARTQTGACPVPCVEAPQELFPADEPEWRFVAVSLGEQHVIALRRDGTLWGWGRNDECQLGCTEEEIAQRPLFEDGAWTPIPQRIERTPRRLPEALDGSVLFLAGTTTTHVVDRRGQIFGLGVNFLVSMGISHADRDYHGAPTQLLVTHPIDFAAIQPRQLAWGADPHVLVLDERGGVHGMGRNQKNQSSTQWPNFGTILVQPTTLPPGVFAAAVSAGASFGHVVTNAGALWAIGANESGQLGLDTKEDALDWAPVPTCP